MAEGGEHVPDFFDLTVNFNGWIRIGQIILHLLGRSPSSFSQLLPCDKPYLLTSYKFPSSTPPSSHRSSDDGPWVKITHQRGAGSNRVPHILIPSQ
jgi:hypothetical protein